MTLDGAEVGIGKDSHLASEFDLTDRLAPGSQHATLRVVKWSDATFVEDQDQWWHGGITRSVFLYATGAVVPGRHQAIGGLADGPDDRHARAAVDVGFAGTAFEAGWTVEARVDGLGEPVARRGAGFAGRRTRSTRRAAR